jgi:hypothetical protein
VRLAALLIVLFTLSAGVSACGAGTTHRSPRSGGSTGPAGATPRRLAPASGAKRRYLAHFRNDCRTAGHLGKATGDVIAALTAQIQRGNLAAATELSVFLRRLATTYQAGLRGARALGAPPDPDGRDGRAYLDDTQRMIAALRDMGSAVAVLDAHALRSASTRLHTATGAATGAAKRYGFPTCPGGSGGAAPPGPSAGAPV